MPILVRPMILSHAFPLPPKPAFRAPLKMWCDDRGMSIAAVAGIIGVKQQVLERNILPPDHKRFVPASANTRQLIETYTLGAVCMNDWPARETVEMVRHA